MTARAVAAAALLLYAAAFFAALQLATPRLVDRDSYFHARYSAMLPERGLARDFPWAGVSILRDRFADKELLFHAALAPMCRWLPIEAGAKCAVVLFDVAIVGALLGALTALGARAPALFAALLLASGNHLLFRLAMARPHLGAVLLTVAGVAAILLERRRLAFALGFVFAWSYAAPHLLVGLAALDLAGRAAAGAKADARMLLACLGGVALGLVANPYFPDDLRLLRAQDVTVLAQAWGLAAPLGVRLGAEFDPVTTRSLLVTSAGALAAYAGGAAAAIAARERPSARTVSLFFMATGALALLLLSAKFVEYFAPLAVLFAASAATDALAGRPFPRALAAALVAGGLALHGLAAHAVFRAVAATPPPALEGAARWLAANARPGETVVHLSWADFSTLFCFAPEQRYLVAFDPTFTALADPAAARLLEDTREGRIPLDGAALARRFGSRLLVVNEEREGPYEAAVRAGLEERYEDGRGAVFELPEAESATAR